MGIFRSSLLSVFLRNRSVLLAILSFFLSAINCYSQTDGELKISMDYAKIYDGSIEQDMGKTFVFYNFLPYDNGLLQPPYPYSNGRVRDGKYKASETAKEEYLKSLDALNGKRYTPVKCAECDNPYGPNFPKWHGVVMAGEDGDTLFFVGTTITGELFNVDYISAKKKDIGSTLYYSGKESASKIYGEIPFMLILHSFKDVKTGKLIGLLPYQTEWKVEDVSLCLEYIGEQNATNNQLNSTGSRIKYVISNTQYGTFECFPHFVSSYLTPDDKMKYEYYLRGDDDWKILSETEQEYFTNWSKKGLLSAAFCLAYHELNNTDSANKNIVPDKIIECAKKGYLPALYVCTKRSVENVDSHEMLVVLKKLYKTFDKKDCLILLGNITYGLGRKKTVSDKDEITRLNDLVEAYTLMKELGDTNAENMIKSYQERKAKLAK